MRRVLTYALLLMIAMLIPVERADLGKLKPVEAVLLYISEGDVIIRTDTEDEGRGDTVEAALEDLKATTAGVIYLDTADYLIVGNGAEFLTEEVGQHLKGSVRVCRAQPYIDITKAAAHLAAHTPDTKLRDWNGSGKIQLLEDENGRMRLY